MSFVGTAAAPAWAAAANILAHCNTTATYNQYCTTYHIITTSSSNPAAASAVAAAAAAPYRRSTTAAGIVAAAKQQQQLSWLLRCLSELATRWQADVHPAATSAAATAAGAVAVCCKWFQQ